MTELSALYTVADIRAIEHAAVSGLPAGTLMQRAGQAAAKAAWKQVPSPRGDARILVLSGPGNNGGDALETAYRLALAGVKVSVLLCAEPDKQSADARQALARAKGSGVHFHDPAGLHELQTIRWTLVVDGLFGIGLARPIDGVMQELVRYVNSLSCPVLALDVPSGLNADTGAIVGDQGVAIRASHTITFIGNKPGLHTYQGRDCAGKVLVETLDIDKRYFMPPSARLNHIKLFSSSLVRRPHDSHKGSFGDVIVIGGARGMGGAPILAARSAAKCGTGRVFAGFLEDPPPYDAIQPELMCRLAGDLDLSDGALVVGPGLGTSRAAHDLVSHALHADNPLVLDADALNLVAAEPGLQRKLEARRGGTLLTPHPLEAARLLGTSAAAVQNNRPEAARKLARQFNATIVLKGSGTIIARDGDALVINNTGNPALATAGTGDVLAGICGALLAQGWPAWEAALAAVWLHGTAADSLVTQVNGPVGLTASELIPFVRNVLNRLIGDYAGSQPN